MDSRMKRWTATLATTIFFSATIAHGQTITFKKKEDKPPFIVDTTNSKAVKLGEKKLTYIWTCNACPSFINTEYKYGFKIQRAGCIETGKIRRHNRRVVRQINKVYGRHWFQNNKSNFY
jgi:hypothetical protein